MTNAMKCAIETAKYLAKHEAHGDVYIYVDHGRYKISDAGELLFDIKAEPTEYFEYAGDFMSMSFEGILYDFLNYGFEFGETKIADELEAIFKKYGKYSEFGNSWNCSLYNI